MADGDNDGRVLIAFDDGPLEPDPTWTRLDDTPNLVADIEIAAGKQEEFDESETNHATVRLNDKTGDFDPNNSISPYFGKLAGKQILLQVYNPITASWYERFRGVISKWGYDLHPATRDGVSVLANIAVDCVGVFDHLARLELIAGLHGDPPPGGQEDSVFYEDGEVNTRIIAVLTDAGVDSTRYVVFDGNVLVQESFSDSGDPALAALRDAADAETPAALANIYEDRHGRFVFHGRQARLDPATVAAGAGPTAWDYQVFKIGDGAAIIGDPDYAQMRPPFQFRLSPDDLINASLVIPRGVDRTTVPTLVVTDPTSMAANGPHPFTYQDSINDGHKTNGDTASQDTRRSSEFLVGNYKDLFVRVEALTVKAIDPADDRATPTWLVHSKADIGDTVTLTAGYPGSVGIDNDYFIEGWRQTITPLNSQHDMVELSLNLSPHPTFNPYDDT